MESVKQQLEDARYLIKTKRYDEARTMLEGIHHPIAEKWLGKLETKSTDKKKKKKAKKEAPSWLQGMEDLSQAEASPTLTDGPSKIWEQIENPNKKDRTNSQLWEDKGKEKPEVTVLPRSILGGLIGALLGTAVWTGAIIATMVSFNEFFQLDTATFTTFSVFGGTLIGLFTGMVARMLSGRGSFYGGVINAGFAAVGFYGSKVVSLTVLLTADLGLQPGSDVDMSVLSHLLGSAANPFLLNPVTDGVPLVVAVLMAWAVASSLGGVLE